MPQTTPQTPPRDDAVRILIADLVGLKFASNGVPDPSEVAEYIEAQGASFTHGPWDGSTLPAGAHFFYMPDLSTAADLEAACGSVQYHAIIAAATHLPPTLYFPEGGVRIGAGTGNMACQCWGGADGGGRAPLMNTPSFNSRATAQMVMKALLHALPALPVAELHERVVAGDFDTGKHLRDYPTTKLEGKRMAVLGYGNIGREVAKLGRAFGMEVAIFARPKHQQWIESEGFIFAETMEEAAQGADVLTPHIGLGADGCNINSVNDDVFDMLNDGAVLINYDRGEVVDTCDLENAMAMQKIRIAAIDADLFCAENGALSGPMLPYLQLAKRFGKRVQLLPHAAADTEHNSRVDGAKQAVDQILSAIFERVVINGKGAVPAGYTDGGAQTVRGVGTVLPSRLEDLHDDEIATLQQAAEDLAKRLKKLQSSKNKAKSASKHGAKITKSANVLCRDLECLGLTGPFQDPKP